MKLKRIEGLLKEASRHSAVEVFYTVGYEPEGFYRVQLHLRWNGKSLVLPQGSFKPSDQFEGSLQKHVDKIFYGDFVRSIMGPGVEGVPSVGMVLYQPPKYFDKLIEYYEK